MREAIGAASPDARQYVSSRALLHYARAMAELASGDPDGAITDLRLTALYGGDDAPTQSALARAWLEAGDEREAADAAHAALEIDAAAVPALIVLARVDWHSGNLDRAASWLRRARAGDPESFDVRVLSVELTSARGETRPAVIEVTRLADTTAASPSLAARRVVAGLLDRIAALPAVQANGVEAEGLLDRAVALEREEPERLVALAQFLETHGRPVEAAQTYAQALSVSNGDPRFALDAARLYLTAGRRAEAGTYIGLLADSDRGRLPLLRLGEMLAGADATAEAINAYRAAAEESPGWAEPLMREGALLERDERFSEAAKVYRQVAPEEQRFEEARVQASLCDMHAFAAAGRQADAAALARQLASGARPAPDALAFLSLDILARQGDLAEAERDASAAWSAAPDNGGYQWTLGRVLLAEQKPDAMDTLERAAVTLPREPLVQLDLAEASLLAQHADVAQVAVGRLLAESAALDGAARARLAAIQSRIAAWDLRPSTESLRANANH